MLTHVTRLCTTPLRVLATSSHIDYHTIPPQKCFYSSSPIPNSFSPTPPTEETAGSSSDSHFTWQSFWNKHKFKIVRAGVGMGAFGIMYIAYHFNIFRRIRDNIDPPQKQPFNPLGICQDSPDLTEYFEQIQRITPESENSAKHLVSNLRRWKKDSGLGMVKAYNNTTWKAACFFSALSTGELTDEYNELGHFAAECLLKLCKAKWKIEKQSELWNLVDHLTSFFENQNLNDFHPIHLAMLGESLRLIIEKILESSTQKPIPQTEKTALFDLGRRVLDKTSHLNIPDLKYHLWCAHEAIKAIEVKKSDMISDGTDVIKLMKKTLKSELFHVILAAISERNVEKATALADFIFNPQKAQAELEEIFGNNDLIDQLRIGLSSIGEEGQLYLLATLTQFVGTKEEIRFLVNTLLNEFIIDAPPPPLFYFPVPGWNDFNDQYYNRFDRLQTSEESISNWQKEFILLELIERLLNWQSNEDQKKDDQIVIQTIEKLITANHNSWIVYCKLHQIISLFENRCDKQTIAQIRKKLENRINSLEVRSWSRVRKGIESYSSRDDFLRETREKILSLSDQNSDLPPLAQRFMSRTQDISAIDGLFKHHSTIVISGLPGSGKTQLARAFCQQNELNYDAIFFLNAQNDTTLKQGVSRIADDLAIPRELDSRERRAEARKALIEQKNVLLVVDNADSEHVYNLITPELPVNSEGIHVLITSRLNEEKVNQWNTFRIQPPSEEKAIEYLLSFANSSTSERESAQQIVKRVHCIPLALASVAAYIQTTKRSLKRYLELFDKGLRILNQVPSRIVQPLRNIQDQLDQIQSKLPSNELYDLLMQDLQSDLQGLKSISIFNASNDFQNKQKVETTFDRDYLSSFQANFDRLKALNLPLEGQITSIQDSLDEITRLKLPLDGYGKTLHIVCKHLLQAIKKQDPSTIEAIRCIGTLNFDQIPDYLLEEWKIDREMTSSQTVDKFSIITALDITLGILIKHCLLERINDTCSIHPVYHEIYAHSIKKTQPTEEDWKTTLKVLDKQLRLYHQNQPKTWSRAEALLSHCDILANHIAAKLKNSEAVSFLIQVAKIKRMLIKAKDAETFYQLAIDIQREIGNDEKVIAKLKYRLSRALIGQSRYCESKKNIEEVLAIQTNPSAPEDPSVLLRTYWIYSHILSQLGDYQSAEKAARDGLKLHENVSEPTRFKAQMLYGLAWALMEQRKYPESKACFEEALRIYPIIYKDQNYRTRPRILWAEYSLGFLALHEAHHLKSQGRTNESEIKYKESERSLQNTHQALVEIYKDRGAPLVCNVRNAQGEIMHAQGQYDEAEAYFRETLKMMENEKVPSIEARTKALLGKVLIEKGMIKEAVTILTEAVEKAKQVFPDNWQEHPKVLEFMSWLKQAEEANH